MAQTTEHFPEYEPNKLYEAGDLVYVEGFCTCGGILRIRGPVEEVLPFVETYQSRHNGEGHEPTDKLTACRAREEIRRRAFEDGQARGFISQKEKYEPADWDAKNIGVTSEEVLAQ